MAKLVLVVAIIVCLGAALGAVGYLVSNNLPPMTTPIMTTPMPTHEQCLKLESKISEDISSLDSSCEIDSDCKTLIFGSNWKSICVNRDTDTNEVQSAVKSFLKKCPFPGVWPPIECLCKENKCTAIEENGEEADETADWKIYKNEEYGFEVKYPDDWTVDNTGSHMISLDNYNFCSKKDRDGCFRVSVFLAQDENSSSYQKEFEVMEKIITKKKDNKLFVFSITVEEKAKTILNEAMSAFKFIEIKSTDNLKTYKNEKYNYEINYPETYSIFQGLKQKSEETIPVDTESEKIYITNNLSMFFCCEPAYLSIEILNELISEDNFEKWVDDRAIINKDNNYRIIKRGYFDFAGELAYRIYDECGIDSPKNIILLNHEGNTYYGTVAKPPFVKKLMKPN